MKELKKRSTEAEDMLITHKPVLAPDPDKLMRSGTGPESMEVKGGAALESLAKKLARTKDKRKRKAILETIQKKFGNEAASRAIHDTVVPGDGDIPAPVHTKPGPEKGKA